MLGCGNVNRYAAEETRNTNNPVKMRWLADVVRDVVIRISRRQNPNPVGVKEELRYRFFSSGRNSIKRLAKQLRCRAFYSAPKSVDTSTDHEHSRSQSQFPVPILPPKAWLPPALRWAAPRRSDPRAP